MTNDFTVTFTQPAALETVGGKGLNLMRLTRVGMPVPSALLFRRRFTELL
jgi:hypothetical protein